MNRASFGKNKNAKIPPPPIKITLRLREQKNLILNYATGESFSAIKSTLQASVDQREKEALSARRLLEADGHGAVTLTFPSLTKGTNFINFRETNRYITDAEDSSKRLKPLSFLTHRLFANENNGE